MMQEMLETEQTNSLLKLTELQHRLRRKGGKKQQQQQQQQQQQHEEKEGKGEEGGNSPLSPPSPSKHTQISQDHTKLSRSSFPNTPEKEKTSGNVVLPVPTSPSISPFTTPNTPHHLPPFHPIRQRNEEEEEREKEKESDED